MFTLEDFKSKSRVRQNVRRMAACASAEMAALTFAADLLKNNNSNESAVDVTISSPFERRKRFTVVRRKLRKTYHNGFRFMHYIKQ